MINEKLLKKEEKAVFELRSLYRQYGYQPFKMNKFEEYDFYVRNKDFLVSDSVITFNDTNGKLLALKPDVTLSIIKNTKDKEGCKQKLCYNENVYRVSGSTHQFKEIMQTGLECIGDIDISDIYEVIYLASKSLDMISNDFIIDISHMGIITSLLLSINKEKAFHKEAIKYISEKNPHELYDLCKRNNVDEEKTNQLIKLVQTYGNINEVIESMEKEGIPKEIKKPFSELKAISKLIKNSEYSSKFNIDFSVVNDMNYYNGIVFKGFLKGVSEGVLSGGQYDSLMVNMGRNSKAIGFALYLDLLEEIDNNKKEFDVDVLLLYDDKISTERLIREKEKLISIGFNVSAQKKIPEGLRYMTIMDLNDMGVQKND